MPQALRIGRRWYIARIQYPSSVVPVVFIFMDLFIPGIPFALCGSSIKFL